MKKLTTARYAALQWFADHERDPLSVLMAAKPSTKMRRLMAREGQVFRVPVGQFNYDRWLLTDAGRAALASRPKGRKHAHQTHTGTGNDAGAGGPDPERQGSRRSGAASPQYHPQADQEQGAAGEAVGAEDPHPAR
ncbi:hypothetical protein QIH85_23850 [Bradyrhizobium japonicum]|nr:hypothetical protein [Bradyrhizobium japonicum]WLB24917.1 hypothetical protein QIH85_23850 [Bradyrhizobium japonicum]